MSLIINAVAFLIVIGILVTVHEFGHFWVARRCGVGVERFSIGFGRVVLRRFGRDGVEYALSAIPLGGYVKMVDEREGSVPEDQLHRAFNRKPLWQRNAVIVAGPAFNFIFAILVFWGLFLLGDTVMRPVLDDVPPQTPAAEAGFQSGDEIRRVGSKEVSGWSEVMREVLAQGAGNASLPVTVRTAEGSERTRQLDVAAIGPAGQQEDPMQALGWRPQRPPLPAAIRQVLPDTPAARAGLEAGDRLEAIGGQSIDQWQGLVDGIEAHRGQSMRITLVRDGERRQLAVAVPDEGKIGVAPAAPEPDDLAPYQRRIEYGPIAALGRGLTETWDYLRLTVTIAAKIVTGDASTRNISGPVSIAEYAGTSATYGIKPFLNLLGTISISLGLINLFPVPVLDGGHLLFNTCEWVMGRPLSEHAQSVGTQIGLALIVMLMALALYNDLLRVMGVG